MHACVAISHDLIIKDELCPLDGTEVNLPLTDFDSA